jgi:iron(III) transport system ATP-binding protein
VLFRGDRYIVHTDNRDIFELDDKVIMKPLEQAVVLEQNQAIQ